MSTSPDDDGTSPLGPIILELSKLVGSHPPAAAGSHALPWYSFAHESEQACMPHEIRTVDGKVLRTRGCIAGEACGEYLKTALADGYDGPKEFGWDGNPETLLLQELLSPAEWAVVMTEGRFPGTRRACVLCHRAQVILTVNHFQRGNMDDERARAVGARWSLQSHYNKFEVGEYADKYRWSPPGERYGTAPLVRFDTTGVKLVYDTTIRTLRMDQSAMQWVDVPEGRRAEGGGGGGGGGGGVRGRDVAHGIKFDLAIKPVGLPLPTLAPLLVRSGSTSPPHGGGGGPSLAPVSSHF